LKNFSKFFYNNYFAIINVRRGDVKIKTKNPAPIFLKMGAGKGRQIAQYNKSRPHFALLA